MARVNNTRATSATIWKPAPTRLVFVIDAKFILDPHGQLGVGVGYRAAPPSCTLGDRQRSTDRLAPRIPSGDR